MQVNCKKCGKDVTQNVNEFFQGVRNSPKCDDKDCSLDSPSKILQENIAKEFELFDEFIERISKENGTTKY
jgi:hypothetical protein